MRFNVVIISFIAITYGQEESVETRVSLPTGRIVGGKEAIPHEAPYIVSLRNRNSGRHFCGGSIIAESWILTAAHCLGRSASSIKVVAGAHNLDQEVDIQTAFGDLLIKHEKYRGDVGPYDVGLIHLAEPFSFNENVKAIRIPIFGKIHSGSVTLFGWGSTSTTSFPMLPRILQTVTLPIVEYSECKAAVPNSPLHETNVCSGPLTGGVSACSGDSGGPLVQASGTDMDNVELVGIVSWGYIPCGSRNSPSVYTRTSAYNDWIDQKKELSPESTVKNFLKY